MLNTVFQIWEKRDKKRKKIVIPDHKLVKKIIPKMKSVTSHRKVKKTLYEKDGSNFVKYNTAVYEKVSAKRPDYVKGANFEMIVFGYSCGKCSDITDLKIPAKTTTMYFQIERDDVKQALKDIDFSRHYNNVSYVQALSLQEINYELNKYFGLSNFKF